ncbi:MAG: PH domain-containing protein [Clostridiaceae bacterium]
MEYKPEKNNIKMIIMAILLLVDAVIIALFISMGSARIKGMLTFVFLLINLYGGYFLMLSITLKYTLSDKELTITGVYGLKKIQIPVAEILSWSRKISLLENLGMGFATARFALGKGFDNTGEQAELFITSSKKVIYLKTNRGNYGISPEKVDEFVVQLKELGIAQQMGMERHYLKSDQNRGHGALNQLTLYCILLTAILLMIPLAMYVSGLLPDLVQVSTVGYMTRAHYLESVLTRGLIALLMLLVAYGVTIMLSNIEGKYYYRIMLLPLGFVVILLFLEVNTQLNVLMG